MPVTPPISPKGAARGRCQRRVLRTMYTSKWRQQQQQQQARGGSKQQAAGSRQQVAGSRQQAGAQAHRSHAMCSVWLLGKLKDAETCLCAAFGERRTAARFTHIRHRSANVTLAHTWCPETTKQLSGITFISVSVIPIPCKSGRMLKHYSHAYLATAGGRQSI